MKQFLFSIKYDGSEYHGWQVQSNAITVQEVFQNAVEKVFGERLDVKGCSRTDSGVHANMYCVSIKTDTNMSTENLLRALNTYLPKSIAVFDCKVVPLDFHPRYSCKSKCYVYKIYNGKTRNPFYEKYAFHYPYKIDCDYLNKEAQAFVGKYDYKGFCSSKTDVEDTVRCVKKFSIWRDGDVVMFSVEADGFLYNMVRIMIGTLLFISEGKIKQGELKEVILSKNRKRAGKTAPPQGLYLDFVKY